MAFTSTPPDGPAYTYSAVVEEVLNGDTIRLTVDFGARKHRRREKFQLTGIDAPEIRGENLEAGRAAKTHLETLLPAETEVVVIMQKKGDTYYVEIWKDRENINRKMVEDGHAVEADKP